MTEAARLVALCERQGRTIATAESLTAGLVAAGIADVPGASAVLRGGVVAYATEVKGAVLGLDPADLEHVVSERVAEQLAVRACAVLDADLGIGTTGVAGPDWLDGQRPGTAWIAVHDRRAQRTRSRLLKLAGDRQAVRRATAEHAWSLAIELLLAPGGRE